MSRAVAAGSFVSGWEFLSKYYTARMVRISGAGGLAFLILFSQFSAFFFLFFLPTSRRHCWQTLRPDGLEQNTGGLLFG